MPANSVFDGTINSRFKNVILRAILSPALVQGEKCLNGFKFGTFIVHFLSDGMCAKHGSERVKS